MAFCVDWVKADRNETNDKGNRKKHGISWSDFSWSVQCYEEARLLLVKISRNSVILENETV